MDKPAALDLQASSSTLAPDGVDKDEPLKEDIRLLGRLLGDVLRNQEGEAVFDVVENIRQTAVRFRREDDPQAGEELTTLLKKLTREETNSVVRAFSYFSHLANIAEDQHHVRRRRAHQLAGSKPQPASVAYALARLQDAGVGREQIASFLRDALISPVLTAHPTEVVSSRVSFFSRVVSSSPACGSSSRRKRTAVWRMVSTTSNTASPSWLRSTSPSRRPSRRMSSFNGASFSEDGVGMDAETWSCEAARGSRFAALFIIEHRLNVRGSQKGLSCTTLPWWMPRFLQGAAC